MSFDLFVIAPVFEETIAGTDAKAGQNNVGSSRSRPPNRALGARLDVHPRPTVCVPRTAAGLVTEIL
jgi:hypothetical protein